VAAAMQPDDDGAIVGINVTPLVDITLVLLIIFIVTARIISQQGVPMDVPTAASAGTVQSVFTVSIDEQGGLFADGQPVAERSLRVLAARALARDPALRTVIQADGRARHAAVIHVLDELRLAGVARIAFAAEPPADRDRAGGAAGAP
jgi:biopolymer transport protein ExbD